MKQIPPEEVPLGVGYTIGSALIFPGNRIDGKQTINQARGTHPRVRDRFDLHLHHFEDFTTPPVPNQVPDYLAYRERSSAFIAARNRRIQDDLASRPTGNA